MSTPEPGSPQEEAILGVGIKQYRRDRNFLLDLIDWDASLRLQARMGADPIIEAEIDRYRMAMEQGESFPPIIVYQETRDRFVVISGLHRSKAAVAADLETIDAWVITEASRAQLQMLAFDENKRHGIPIPEGDRVKQAAHMVALGMSARRAAREMLVSEANVLNYVSTRRGEMRLADLAPKLAGLIPKKAIQRMSAIRSDRRFVATAVLISEVQIPMDGFQRLVTQINRAGTEEEADRLIEEAREAYADRNEVSVGGRIATPAVITRLSQGVSLLAHANADELAEALPLINDGRRVDLVGRIDLAMKQLRAVRRVLE